MTAMDPLFYEKFRKSLDALGPFENNPRIAVALSGGSDSLALTILANRWVKEKQGSLVAVHVDHLLRESSTHEALQVKSWMEAFEIPCYIFPWNHPPISTSIQEQARQGRYHLLKNFCREQGIFHILLGHHQGDQIETFFHRLERKSGLDGLSGMSSVEEGNFVRLLRPLLGWTKEELASTLEGHPFIQDPSNHNPKYWRGLFRQSSVDEVTFRSFQSTREESEALQAEAILQYGHISKEGVGTLQKNFLELSHDLKKKVLTKFLTTIGGHFYPVRLETVHTLLEKMPSLEIDQWLTGGGCLIGLWKDSFLITREIARIRDEIRIESEVPFLWDGRFFVDGLSSRTVSEGFTCRSLGPQGLRQVKEKAKRKKIHPYPARALYGLPAFFDEQERVVFFPFGDFKDHPKMIDCPVIRFMPRHRVLRSLWKSIEAKKGPGVVLL